MTYVSVTRLRIRDDAFLGEFVAGGAASAGQAGAAPGNLGVEVLADAESTFWTKSVWTGRDAMRAFMSSGMHAEMMPKLRIWCDEAQLAHWEQEGAELPTWAEAHRQLVAIGRASAVAHPSPAHASLDVPFPVVPG